MIVLLVELAQNINGAKECQFFVNIIDLELFKSNLNFIFDCQLIKCS